MANKTDKNKTGDKHPGFKIVKDEVEKRSKAKKAVDQKEEKSK